MTLFNGKRRGQYFGRAVINSLNLLFFIFDGIFKTIKVFLTYFERVIIIYFAYCSKSNRFHLNNLIMSEFGYTVELVLVYVHALQYVSKQIYYFITRIMSVATKPV